MMESPNPYPTAAHQWRCPPGRRLPPYSKEVAAAYLRGQQPKRRQAMVFLDTWPGRITAFGPGLVCPQDDDPESFDWRMLAGLDLFVVPHDYSEGDRVRRLLAELLSIKPRRLIVLRRTAPHAQWIVSASRGIEVQP